MECQRSKPLENKHTDFSWFIPVYSLFPPFILLGETRTSLPVSPHQSPTKISEQEQEIFQVCLPVWFCYLEALEECGKK